MTRRASVGWRLARIVARLGAFRLLARSPHPGDRPRARWRAARERGRRGRECATSGTGQHPRVRSVRSIRSRSPRSPRTPWAGRVSSTKGQIGERLRAALPAPLSGPRLLGSGDAYLLFEAVDWVGRARAWELPEDVAWAMGRFHAAGRVARRRRRLHARGLRAVEPAPDRDRLVARRLGGRARRRAGVLRPAPLPRPVPRPAWPPEPRRDPRRRPRVRDRSRRSCRAYARGAGLDTAGPAGPPGRLPGQQRAIAAPSPPARTS